jgi:pimeloyl-ACP methyl ester carboxylesterase
MVREETAVRQEVRSADGTLIPVWISGNGRPIVIVHGAVSDHSAFGPLRERLETKLTVAAIDRRPTFTDPFSRYSIEREHEDIQAVAAILGDAVDLFGHSAGAVCALGAALGMATLRRLLLYEPPMRQPEWPQLVEKLNDLQRAGDMEGVFAAWIHTVTGVPEEAARNAKSTPIGAELFAWVQGLPQEMAAVAEWSIDVSRYADFPAPTLFLVGSQSPRRDGSYREVLDGVIPDFRVRELEGQGHFAHVLAPDLLATAILEFVEG